jgi:hypothetical protein
MSFRLYTSDSGGTELWAELHSDVDVLDGVYEVALGSIAPLSPGLLSGGAVYLEIDVEGETLTPRQRLLAVPFALVAEEASAVGGVPSAAVEQIYQNFAFDGADPPNDDPTEGLADVDGDGVANFLDSDNDNDGRSDSSELNAGTDINLVTPRISSLNPSQARICLPTQVQVSGSNFEPGLSVEFGSQPLAPQNLTLTDFSVVAGPQPAGSITVTVSNTNGEMGTRAFSFFEVSPTITDIDPDIVFTDLTSLVRISGTNFESGLTVTLGAENLTPMNVTQTGFDISVGPQSPGSATLTLMNECGEQDTGELLFVEAGIKRVFVSSVTYDGNLGGLAGADALCAQLASDAGLSGAYLAWLSDGVDSPDTRFSKAGSPIVLVDGTTIVAADWIDLTNGTLQTSIGMTELGGTNPGVVFSNVMTDGTTKSTNGGASHCNGWLDSSVNYRAGSTVHVGAGWTDLINNACALGRLYCFEQ